MPGPLQCGRQPELLGDLGAGAALVEEAQGLVVQVGVEVALGGEEGDGVVEAPGGPVVGGEGDVVPVPEELDRLVEVAGPDPGVAHDRAAQGQDVVHVVGGVLRQAQGPQVGEEEVHLGGGFGAGGELEDDADAVDRLLLTRAGDVERGRDEGDRAGGGGHAQSGADLPVGRLGQPVPVHEHRAAAHGVARVDVLADGVLQESGRGQDGHAGLGPGREDPAGAAEVVAVGVGVDHGRDAAVPAVLPIEGQGRGGGLRGNERVDDHDALVAFDEGHVRQVQAPDLVDAVGDPVEALLGAEPGLAPQAGVGGVGAVAVEEGVGVVVVDHAAVGRPDHGRGQRCDEAAVGVLEIGRVLEGQCAHP